MSPMNQTQEVLLKTNDKDPEEVNIRPFKKTPKKRGSMRLLEPTNLSKVLNHIDENDSDNHGKSSDSDIIV